MLFPATWFLGIVLQLVQCADNSISQVGGGAQQSGLLSPRRGTITPRESSGASVQSASDSSEVSESELIPDAVRGRAVWQPAYESTDSEDLSESASSSDEDGFRMTRERWMQMALEHPVADNEDVEEEEDLEFGHLTPAERLEGFGMKTLAASAAREFWAAINRNDQNRGLLGLFTLVAMGMILRWDFRTELSFYVAALIILAARRPH